jgi:hypothetical protein
MWQAIYACRWIECGKGWASREVERDPRTASVQKPICPECDREMTLGPVSDLSPYQQPKHTARFRKAGFKATQLPLFKEGF